MRKALILSLLMLLLAAFSLIAEDTAGSKSLSDADPITVYVRGEISSEELQIRLQRSGDEQGILSIDLGDFPELNNGLSFISNDTYCLAYSYNRGIGAGAMVVQASLTSLGLSRDGGASYPISLILVSPDDPEEEVQWDELALGAGATSKFVEWKTFKIRLDNISGTLLTTGTYSGELVFQLSSI
jgi:hypothetical protein